MPRGNPQNLDPVRSNEEARKRGSAGGKKSGVVRRNKAMLKDCLEILMERKMVDGNGKKITGAEAQSISLFLAALQEPDTAKKARAFEVLRDTAGQKPIDKIMISEVDQNVIDEVEAMMNDDEE